MSPNTCPHCAERVRKLELHLRDTGSLAERPTWACPVLFEKRRPS